ncbi:MAG: hypothetical protein ACMXX7_02280 [Candidatus Woesearchaeota archaeon]
MLKNIQGVDSMILQIHQPYRLKDYSIFEVGKNPFYFDSEKDFSHFKEYESKTLNLLNEIEKSKKKVFVSVSGVMIEKIEKNNSVLKSKIKDLIKKNIIEIVGETHHSSISHIFSIKEFEEQVVSHKNLLIKSFNIKPRVFKNTFLAFSESIAKSVKNLGFEYAIAIHNQEGSMNVNDLKVLGVKKDICKDVTEFDINMSFDIISKFENVKNIAYEESVFEHIENNLQKSAFEKLFSLEKKVKENSQYLDVWRSLTSHDHFLNMSKKSFREDNNPYEYFINYRNVLEDLSLRLN